MKQTILVTGLLISISGYSQKKDSITYLPDSVNTISITDIQKVLTTMEDRLSKKDWDIWLKAFQTLAATTEEKRKTKPAPKK